MHLFDSLAEWTKLYNDSDSCSHEKFGKQSLAFPL